MTGGGSAKAAGDLRLVREVGDVLALHGTGGRHHAGLEAANSDGMESIAAVTGDAKGADERLASAGVTLREAEVLTVVAQRLRNREIAERLHVSVRTVESHVAALLRKLGAADRAALVRMGADLGRDRDHGPDEDGVPPMGRQVVQFAPVPGGRVAYSVLGAGPPLVCMFGWVSHLGLLWEMPAYRRFVQALADRYTVIRYDRLGCGLSDRARDAFTLESELESLRALIGHLGIGRCAVLGSCDSGQVAAAFAAQQPEVVSSLVVHGSCARGSDLAPQAVRHSVLSLVNAHWGLGSRVLADIWLPDAPAEQTELFARLQRTAATAHTAAALLEMFYRSNIGDILPAIRVPTLVTHRRGGRAVPFELGRRLAAMIPGAQLAVLEGRLQPIYCQGEDLAAATILKFLRQQRHGVLGA